jgi:uncharacterized membrane protein
MGNDVRKWVPLGLIATTVAVTAFVVRDLPATVTIDLRGLLPFPLEPEADRAPRWVAVVLMPGIAAVLWTMFQVGRAAAGLRIARFVFNDIPERLADPQTIDRIHATYDTIVLWVIVLVLGVHAGMIAAALDYGVLAPRLIVLVIGISLAAMGNVMPRLRPNLIAGVRTKATLNDPHLWRLTHRILGGAFVMAGAITVVVGLLAPAYGLITAVVTLIGACVVAAIGGARARRLART